MAQTAKETQPELAPFVTYQAVVDGNKITYRTRKAAPIAVLVAYTPEGDVHVWRWTSSEKLAKRGLAFLEKSEDFTSPRAITDIQVVNHPTTLLGHGSHRRTMRVVSAAEFEAARPKRRPRAKKSESSESSAQVFETKKAAIDGRPEGMSIKAAKAALEAVDGGYRFSA